MEQPHVLNGDHGLIGESFEEGNLLVGKRANLGATNPYAPDGHTFSQQRSIKYGSSTSNLLRDSTIRIFSVDLRFDIMDVNCLAVDDGSASGKASTEWQKTRRLALAQPRISPQPEGCRLQGEVLPRRLHRITCAAFSATTSSTGCNIRRRAGNHAQDFTRGSLLFQRLLEFVEQPDVLDGNHRLVGESLKQFDLRRGEGAHLDATRGQCSNEFPLLTKGSGQE